MAQTLCIQGADGRPMHAMRRSPAAPALLPFFTFGFYYLYWHYAINRELCDFGRVRGIRGLGTSPGMSLLAVTFGWVLIVPPFISHLQTTRRIKRAQRAAGLAPLSSFFAIFLGFCFWPARPAYIQSELNGLWVVAAGGPSLVPQAQQWAPPARMPLPAAPPPAHGTAQLPATAPVALLAPPPAEAIVAPAAYAIATPPPQPETRVF